MSARTDAVPATVELTLPPRTSLMGLARAATGGFGLNIVNTAATVLTTVALARLMDLDAFGTYSWVVATVYLLTVPALLGVDRLLIRDIAVYLSRQADAHVRGLMRRSIQAVIVTCSLIVVAVVVVTWAAGPATDGATALALAIGVLALPALALAWVAQSSMIGMHHVVLGQLSELLLRPVLLLLFVAGAALFIHGPITAPVAAVLFTASAALAALAAFVLLRRQSGKTVRVAAPSYDSRRWMMAALGLVLLSGAQFANSQVGVVMLGFLDHAQAAGLYAVAQRGALLVAFPLLALNAALAPTAARLWAQKEVARLQRLVTAGSRGALLAAVPIALTFVLIGGALLELVFGRSFAASGAALAILSVAQLFNVATGTVATLLMMTGYQARAGIGIGLGLAINVVLCVLLVPQYHVAGAAIAAAVGIVVSNLIHVVMARRALGLDPTPLGLLGKPVPK